MPQKIIASVRLCFGDFLSQHPDAYDASCADDILNVEALKRILEHVFAANLGVFVFPTLELLNKAQIDVALEAYARRTGARGIAALRKTLDSIESGR